MSELPLPPGPRDWMPVRIYKMWTADPLAYMIQTAREYGDIAYMDLGAQHLAQVNHPDFVQDILVTHKWNFTKRRVNQKEWREILGEGLLDSEGDFHMHERRLLEPAFRRDRIAAYGATMAGYASRQCADWKDGGEVDVYHEMLRLTLAIAGKAFLDADVESGEADEISRAVTMIYELNNLLKNPLAPLLERLPLPTVKHFHAARETLDRIIYGKIAERRKAGIPGDDLLALLMHAPGHEGGAGKLTDTRVRDEALTIIIAGHETTANALTFTWHLLAQNPEVEAQLHAEVDAVLGGKLPTPDDVARLPYTEAVFAEAMRLYPPVWCEGRQSVSEYELGGYHLPAGTLILWCQYIMFRDSRWFPDPEKFDPTRLTREARSKLPRFSYFPFGAGPRQCIGENFAWMEAVLVLATLAQRWKLRTKPGCQLELQPEVTLRPKGGLPMTAHAR